ncbi:MAG: hypothetical protein HY904_06455 [Deltaproteobacteria bacterium]|nr:hypothetical protein [Deltaproteobacteria bacterium]
MWPFPMRTHSDPPARRARQRGFGLVLTIAVGAAVLAAGAAAFSVMRTEVQASNAELASTRAYAHMMAGLAHAAAALNANQATAESQLKAAMAGSAASLGSLALKPFNASSPDLSGKVAFDDGDYSVYVADDPADRDGDVTLDSNKRFVLRVVGRHRGSESAGEFEVNLPFLANLPGAFVGCFAGNTSGVKWVSEQGPLAGLARFRIDGYTTLPSNKGQHAIVLNRDFQRMNGLAQCIDGTDSPPCPTNRNPRLFYPPSTTADQDPRRFASAGVGGVGTAHPYDQVLIGYRGGPTATDNYEAQWAAQKDDEARKGIYACDNHATDTTSPPHKDAAYNCSMGAALNGAPNWADNNANHSGLSWNVIQSVVRHCRGNGRYGIGSHYLQVRCDTGYKYLENVAACLILPPELRTYVQKNATLGGTPPAAWGPDGVVGGTDNYREDDGAPNTAVGTNLAGCLSGTTTCNQEGDFRLDFGECNDACVIGTWTGSDSNTYPLSACINLDSAGQHTYGFASGTNNSATCSPPATGSAHDDHVTASGHTTGWCVYNEVGSNNFLMRLDLTDQGPLGTCDTNCLQRVAEQTTGGGCTVPTNAGMPAPGDVDANERCVADGLTPGTGYSNPRNLVQFSGWTGRKNWDSNGDGTDDARSFALFSKPATWLQHPNHRLNWLPSNSTNVWTGSSFADYCDPTSGAQTEMVNLLDSLSTSAATVFDDGTNTNGAVTSGTTRYVGLSAGKSKDGADHTADCHFTDTVDEYGRADPWMDPTQCKPYVVQTASGLNINAGGKICGCGLLLVKGSGGSGSIALSGQLLWYGLIVVYSSAANLTLNHNSSGTSPYPSSFYLEGGFLGVGSGTSTNLNMSTKLNSLTAGMSNHIRYNPVAISEALSKTQTSSRKSFRVLY